MQIEQVLNYKFEPDELITLNLLEQSGVFSYGTEVEQISSQASSEAALEALLKKVIPAYVILCWFILRRTKIAVDCKMFQTNL
jgi:dynein heavy chain